MREMPTMLETHAHDLSRPVDRKKGGIYGDIRGRA